MKWYKYLYTLSLGLAIIISCILFIDVYLVLKNPFYPQIRRFKIYMSLVVFYVFMTFVFF